MIDEKPSRFDPSRIILLFLSKCFRRRYLRACATPWESKYRDREERRKRKAEWQAAFHSSKPDRGISHTHAAHPGAAWHNPAAAIQVVVPSLGSLRQKTMRKPGLQLTHYPRPTHPRFGAFSFAREGEMHGLQCACPRFLRCPQHLRSLAIEIVMP